MSERHGALGLWARQSRADAPVLALLAAVVAVSTALVTAGPLALGAVATAELRTTVAAFDPTRRDFTGATPFGDPIAAESEVDGLFDAIGEALVGASFPDPLAGLLADPQWSVTSPEQAVDPPDPADRAAYRVRLATAPDAADLVTFTAGTAPAVWTAADAAASVAVPIALSTASADRFGVGVGDVLASTPAALVVAGVYRLDDPRDAFWGHSARAAAPSERRGDDGRVTASADAIVAPGSLAALGQVFEAGVLQFWYPLDVDGITLDTAPTIATQIRQVAADPPALPVGDPSPGSPGPPGDTVAVNAALAGDLDAVFARVDAASAVLALVAAGPLGLMLAVLALGVRALLDRRAGALVLVRARGAGPFGVAAGLALEGALVAVPAAVLGVVVAVLALGARDLSVWPAAVVALAVPVLSATDALVRSPLVTRFRWVVEALVVGLAAVAVLVLVRRGTAASGGPDVLVAAAPVLVAAAVTVGVLRLYPAGMRAVRRVAHARVGPVAVVGAARASSAPALGPAATFALVVGVAVATFSAALLATVSTALASPATVRDATFDAGHPLAVALLWALALGVVVPLALAAAAMAVAAVGAARGRTAAVATARVLGFTPAQGRALVGWEFAPVGLLAALAGALLGVGLVLGLGGALDLPGLLDRPAPLVADPGIVAAVVATFAVIATLTATAATAAARRRTSRAARMGVE